MKFTPTHLIAGLALVWLFLFANPANSSANEELSLSVEPLHAGGWTLAILEGAGPQQSVAFLYSRKGVGKYQHTAELTLDLAPPISRVAFTQTNWAGTAMAMIPVGPSIAYHGTRIWGQAVVKDDEGNFFTSPVVTEIVQP